MLTFRGPLLQFVPMHRPAVAYQFDDVILNPETFSSKNPAGVLALEPKSIRLLLYLIQNRSRAAPIL
jgi:hypothetical protein